MNRDILFSKAIAPSERGGGGIKIIKENRKSEAVRLLVSTCDGFGSFRKGKPCCKGWVGGFEVGGGANCLVAT